MNTISKQIDALSPEKRQLLDMLLKRKAVGAAQPHAKPHHIPKPVDTQPFCMITAEDRAKLPPDVEDAYPLSVVQLGMIYHMLQEGDGTSTIIYHNVSSFHLNMQFDQQTFQEATDRVIARHATLRTSFDLTTYREPLQLVHKTAFLPIHVEDLRGHSPDHQREAINRFLKRENNTLLDLAVPPLMRLFFHQVSAQSVWLTLTEPHAISDGWSTHLTLVEILSYYYALLNGEALPAADALKSTYRDFVQLERAALHSEEHKHYWDRVLGELVVSRIPRWHTALQPATDLQDYKRHVDLPPEVLPGVKRLADTAGVPLKSVLLAACVKAVGFVSNQSDLTIGLALNGRPETIDGDQVRGLFLNTLPFRFRLSPGTWVDLVRKIATSEIEMLPFRRYPLAALQKKYRDQPLFDVVFQYLHFHSVTDSLQSGKLEKVNNVVDLSKANFPIMLSFTLVPVQPQRLTLMLEYEATQFSKEQITSFCRYIERILRSMSSDPFAHHHNQTFLSPEEQNVLLFAYNQTQTADLLKCGQSIHGLFEAQVARSPAAVALLSEDQRLTYAELDARANQLAHYLRRLGVGPDVVVGISVERSPELLIGLLGILKAGGAYMPLDPASPPERLALILSDARPPVLLTSRGGAAMLPPHAAAVVDLDIVAPLLGREPSTPPRAAVSEEHLAYVIYTSGSTGIPKGVQIPHRAVVNFLGSMRVCPGISASDTLLAVTTLAFDIAVLELCLPLTVGARVVLVPRDVAGDASRLSMSLAVYQPTIMQATPATWRMLLAAGCAEQPQLRVLCGGEALPPDLARRLVDWSAELWNMYGPTETTIWSTVGQVAGQGGITSLGHPIANTELYVLDPAWRPVPLGSPGELYIGGAGLARGYLRRPELTATRFIPHPFSMTPGARLYRTGDLVRYLPGGTLEFLGRADYQVKVRGYRIELGEIEAVLEQHPQIHEAVVLARDDGAGERQLVAYLVPKLAESSPGADHERSSILNPLSSEVRAFLQQRLPGYMIPAIFVELERMPLNANGKVNRSALPAPDAAARRANLSAAFTPPGTPMEQALAAIWSGVLGVDRVGIHDNFFELGGDSILALQIVIRSNQAGMPITLNQLLRHQTISELARAAPATPPEQEAALGSAHAFPRPQPDTAADTPSDFPEVQLNQSDLARILEKFGNDEDE